MRQWIKLVENVLIDETKGVGVLRREAQGMGLEVMYGEGFALVGGFRSGGASPGMVRVQYSIIDLDIMQELVSALVADGMEKSEAQRRSQEKSNVGTVDIYKDADNAIRAIIDIKLNAKNRKAGLGRAVIQSLVASAPQDVVIFDIRKPAVGFWKKMGAEFYKRGGAPVTDLKTHLVSTPKRSSMSAPHAYLQGVIRKPGSTTPFEETLRAVDPNAVFSVSS